MSDIFRQHRMEPFQILDDNEAKAVLLECGMIGRFKGGPERSLSQVRIPRKEADTAFAEIATCSDHPTHWIIGLRFSGSTNPADNGYVVRCYPKSLVSMEEMEVTVAMLAREMFPDGYDPLIIDLKPPAN